MLWVLKRTVSMSQFFWAHKIYVKIDGKENINNFTLKYFASLKPVDLSQMSSNNDAFWYE